MFGAAYTHGQGKRLKKTRGLFLESPEDVLGPEKPVVKLQSACFEKLIHLHVFKKNQEYCEV